MNSKNKISFNIKLCLLILLLVVSLTHSYRRKGRGRRRGLRSTCLNNACSSKRDCCPYYTCKNGQCIPKNLKIYQQQYARKHGAQHFNQEGWCWLRLCNIEISCCSQHPFCKAIPFMDNWGYCVEYNPIIQPPGQPVPETEPSVSPEPPPEILPSLEPANPTDLPPPIEETEGPVDPIEPDVTTIDYPDTVEPTEPPSITDLPPPSELPPTDRPSVTQPPWCKSAGKMCNDHIECCEGLQCYKFYKLKKGLCLDPEQWEEYRRRYSKGRSNRRRMRG